MFRIDRAHVNIKRSAPPHLLLIHSTKLEDTAQLETQLEGETELHAPQPDSAIETEQAEMAQPDEAPSEPHVEPVEVAVEPEPEPVDIEAMVREAEQQAQAIVSNAQEQARQQTETMLSEAKGQCDELKNKAWQEGYAQGKAEAKEELHAQRLMQKEEVSALIERVHEERNRLLDEIEDDVVRLSVDIARKILHYELDYGNESFVSLVRHAISQMKNEGRVVVRVNPQEYARYFSDEDSRQMTSENMTVTVIEDNYLERGGCIIESDGETINASVDSQLKTISIGFGRQVG